MANVQGIVILNDYVSGFERGGWGHNYVCYVHHLEVALLGCICDASTQPQIAKAPE